MAIFDGCMLLSDVDGTLIDRDYLSPYNVNRIKYFMDNGGRFGLATGRCVDASREIINKIGCNIPSVILNGAAIYDFEANKLLRDCDTEKNVKEILFRVLSSPEWDDVGVEVHAGDRVYTLKTNNGIVIHQKYENLHACKIDINEFRSLRYGKVLLVFDNPERLEPLRLALLDSGVPQNSIYITSASLKDGIHNYIEVVGGSVSKGTGASELARILEIDKDKTFGIGDFYNDIPLLESVGFSAVTAGSPKEVIDSADFVSCSVRDGAVGRFIELIEERMQNNGK